MILFFITENKFSSFSDVVCKERLKLSKQKYLHLIYKEINDLVLNQNSAIEGVQFQKLFEDRFPYDKFQHNLLTNKQQKTLSDMFYE